MARTFLKIDLIFSVQNLLIDGPCTNFVKFMCRQIFKTKLFTFTLGTDVSKSVLLLKIEQAMTDLLCSSSIIGNRFLLDWTVKGLSGEYRAKGWFY